MRRIDQPTDRDVDVFVRLYREHRQVKIVAELTGWSRSCVRSWLAARGVRVTRPGRAVELDHDEMVADYAAGLSAYEVAAIHGCSSASVYLALRQRGIRARTQAQAIAAKTS